MLSPGPRPRRGRGAGSTAIRESEVSESFKDKSARSAGKGYIRIYELSYGMGPKPVFCQNVLKWQASEQDNRLKKSTMVCAICRTWSRASGLRGGSVCQGSIGGDIQTQEGS